MATQKVQKAIARCTREQENNEQSHLRVLRKKTKFEQTCRKLRTRTMIILGAEVLGVEPAKIETPAIRGAISKARRELVEIKEALAALGQVQGHKPDAQIPRKPATGPAGRTGETSPMPALKMITIGFKQMPPVELRSELKRRGFQYFPPETAWKGRAVREAIESLIAAQNANYLVQRFEVSD
jgi:hypothetical protein